MLAYTYQETNKFVLEEKERPRLSNPQDAIVQVTLASICSSDIHIKHGAVPRAVPGLFLVIQTTRTFLLRGHSPQEVMPEITKIVQKKEQQEKVLPFPKKK